MSSQQRPPDIKERTFQFALTIVRLCQRIESQGGVWRLLGKQLLRSGTSIGANVEEGQAAQSRADFIKQVLDCVKGGERNHILVAAAARKRLGEERFR